MKIQRQPWKHFERIIFFSPSGSVQLDLYPEHNHRTGGTAFIYALYVEPWARRTGIARMLMDEAEEFARKEGHGSVSLEWLSEDTPVEIKEWYERRGYVCTYYDKETKYAFLKKKLS